MNELDRLKLLSKILKKTELKSLENLGGLANEIESIYSQLDSVSDDFIAAFSMLWGSLEIIAVTHQEQQTFLSGNEIADLESMVKKLDGLTDKEIRMRLK